MYRYILQRLLWLILITFCVSIMIFTIMFMVPGDPATLILGATATAADKAAYRNLMGLDAPFLTQLGHYLYDTFIKFDFGVSYQYKIPVLTEFASRLPRTMILGFSSMFISAFIGIPVGVYCALHRNSAGDHGIMVLAMVGMSIPQFWLALLMVIFFALKLGWLPAYGIGGIQYYVMPIIAASVGGLAMIARQTRSAVLETVRADFVTTARAKGLPARKVTYKHMLPNALVPIINMLGGTFSMAIAGTVVIEAVFNFPGIGLYMLNGMNARDYPVIRGCVLVLAIFSTVAMLLVDLTYAFIDPRIKSQYVNMSAKKNKKQGGIHV